MEEFLFFTVMGMLPVIVFLAVVGIIIYLIIQRVDEKNVRILRIGITDPLFLNGIISTIKKPRSPKDNRGTFDMNYLPDLMKI